MISYFTYHIFSYGISNSFIFLKAAYLLKGVDIYIKVAWRRFYTSFLFLKYSLTKTIFISFVEISLFSKRPIQGKRELEN